MNFGEEISSPEHWLQILEIQTNPNDKIQVLTQAIAHTRGNLDLRLCKLYAEGCQSAPDFAENLRIFTQKFPNELHFWDLSLRMFPSIAIFQEVLHWVDPQLVWPAYLRFADQLDAVNQLEVLKTYLQYNPADLSTVVAKLTAQKRFNELAKIYLLRGSTGVTINDWKNIIDFVSYPQILEECLARYPILDEHIVPKLAMIRGIEGRSVLLKALQSPSTIDAFCKIYKCATEWYEKCIETLVAKQSQDSINVSKYLREYSNIIQRRPHLLADALVRHQSNCGLSWVYKSQLENRPQFAASILETGIRELKTSQATHISDLYVEYAKILELNGTESRIIYEFLQTAINNLEIPLYEKPNLIAQLARVQVKQDFELFKTTMAKILQAPAFSGDSKVWLTYLELLAAHSPQKNGVLEAFNRCCINRAVTMRIILLCAQVFPANSAENTLIFDRGCQLFDLPLGLPLIKEYLKTSKNAELFLKVLDQIKQPKIALEMLELVDQCVINTFHKRRLYHKILEISPCFEVWHEFINTYPQAGERRQVYEQAINLLSAEDRVKMAEKYLEYEDQFHNNSERVNALRGYINTLSGVKTQHTVKFVASTEP